MSSKGDLNYPLKLELRIFRQKKEVRIKNHHMAHKWREICGELIIIRAIGNYFPPFSKQELHPHKIKSRD